MVLVEEIAHFSALASLALPRPPDPQTSESAEVKFCTLGIFLGSWTSKLLGQWHRSVAGEKYFDRRYVRHHRFMWRTQGVSASKHLFYETGRRSDPGVSINQIEMSV